MDLATSLPAFVIAVVLITASPGPAMALIFRRAAVRGLRGALPTVLGLGTGLYAWALLAAAGFAALVAASEVAFLVLRVVGAVVLIVLGVQCWRAAWRERKLGVRTVQASDLPVLPQGYGWWRAFGEGVVVQLANPKAAVFMIAFYPQFIPPGQPMLATTALLALLQVVLETVLYLALVAGVARAGTWFRRARVRRWLETVSGTILVGLGLRVAATAR